jgi:hypothetical protein
MLLNKNDPAKGSFFVRSVGIGLEFIRQLAEPSVFDAPRQRRVNIH